MKKLSTEWTDFAPSRLIIGIRIGKIMNMKALFRFIKINCQFMTKLKDNIKGIGMQNRYMLEF